jgi:hypothetical protein
MHQKCFETMFVSRPLRDKIEPIGLPDGEKKSGCIEKIKSLVCKNVAFQCFSLLPKVITLFFLFFG